ncbi:SAV_2336 N-terminal domain-related protein [Streptomyces antibioticus]|uniref:SAV_2336 N-terminal domain-related protein n=1 Tax=Streptomyces antibioticus TaxID=1890 RepID=UPI0036856CE3
MGRPLPAAGVERAVSGEAEAAPADTEGPADTGGPADTEGPAARSWVMVRALERPPWPRPNAPAVGPLSERQIMRALHALLDGTPSDTVEDQAFLAEERQHRGTGPAGRWEMTVAVDNALSMEVWQPVVRGLVELLSRLGLCRQERVVEFDSHGPQPSAVAPERVPPGPLLVLTDGIASAWQLGALDTPLHALGQSHSVAVIHLVHDRLWPSTGIRPEPLTLLPTGADGAPSRLTGWEDTRPGVFPVPVLALREDHLKQWADFLTGGANGWIRLPAVLVPRDPADMAPAAAQDGPASAADLLAVFENAGTEWALRLARALAAVPLNLPVMHRVQSRLIPGSAPHLLSELIIAGLLVPVVGRESIRRHDRVTFDFPDGVRELLLSSATRADTVRLFEDAVRFLDRDLGVVGLRGWDNLSTGAPRAPEPPTPESAAFHRVRAAVLSAVSGPYRPRPGEPGP